jgi:tyrosine-protein kinase
VLIFASLLVAAGAAAAYSILKDPVYKASSQIQFVDLSEDLTALGTPVVPQGDQAKGAAAKAELITSERVIAAVADDLDGELTEAQVRDSVQTAVDPDTNLVTIENSAAEAGLAARLANSFALQTRSVATREERRRLNDAADRLRDSIRGTNKGSLTRNLTLQRIAALRSLATFARPVTVASVARPPSAPAAPNPVRDSILALFLGLVFGTLAAFLRDSLDRRLTDAHEVQHALEIPMVGYVEAEALGGVGFSRNGSSDEAALAIEQFRILRSNVEFLAPGQDLKTIAVTSPLAEEGKSTVAAGLATASALAGKQVLLVECDLRRPVFAERFGVPAQPGLTDWTVGKANPAEVVRSVPIKRANGASPGADVAVAPRPLNVIVAGSWAPRPAELLGSDRFGEFLRNVASVYELVILDCAPLLPVSDALEVLPQVDAALICVRLDQTTGEQARAARGAIEHFPSRPTGVVVTGVRPGREGYYYGYYSSVAHRSAVTS